MLTVEAIRTYIDNDVGNHKKQLAKVGQKYYEGQHDIKQYKIMFLDKDGQLQEDKVKSNIKISHPFFTEIVDQAVQYMLSGQDGFIKSDIPELQALLDEYFNENEDFTSELYEVLTGCIAKGYEYAYAYKREDGKTSFQCADSLGVVEVKAKETDDGCEYVIYHYIDRIGKDNKKIRRIQVWDDKQTFFYVQEDDGQIRLDDAQPINPRPHILYNKGNDPEPYFDGFGFIPFFRLDNNRKQTSDLNAIKDLIDDYDLMACGLSNNIQDMSEAYLAVKGFDGDDLDVLAANFRAKKHIGVGDGGDIEIKTVDIPYAARQAKLELDEKNIYRFAFALNTAGLKDTSATTNVAIKSAYSLLDLKANKLEIRLKQFMRKLLKPILAEINEEHETDYQQSDVYFKFEREVPANEHENAQLKLTEAQVRQTEINTLLGLSVQLDNETLMQLICEQLDIDYNDIKGKLPAMEYDDPYGLNDVPIENM